MSTIKINKDNFESTVLNNTKPVLLDFFADWCGPCQMVAPILAEIAAQHPEYVIGKIDVGEETELAVKFQVEHIPTLVVIKDGQATAKAVGFRTKEQILEMLR